MMRFILRTIAAAAISVIVKEVLTRDAQTPLGKSSNTRSTKKVR